MLKKVAFVLAPLMACPLLAGLTIDATNRTVSVREAMAQGLHVCASAYRIQLPSGLEWQGGLRQRPTLSQDGSERKEQSAKSAAATPEGWVTARKDLEELRSIRREVQAALADPAALPAAEWTEEVQATLEAFVDDTQGLAPARPARARRATK